MGVGETILAPQVAEVEGELSFLKGKPSRSVGTRSLLAVAAKEERRQTRAGVQPGEHPRLVKRLSPWAEVGADHLKLRLSDKSLQVGVAMQTAGRDPKFSPEARVSKETRAATQNLLPAGAVPVVAVEQYSPARMDREPQVVLAELGDNST